MPNSEMLKNQLLAILRSKIEGFTALVSCEQLTAGASQETYKIVLETAGGERTLALRRGQASQTGKSVPGQLALATEAYLLQRASQANIPVPDLVYVLDTEDELGEGYLMEWLEGETLGHRIVRSDALAGARPLLARQCGEALAGIHSIELDDALKQLLPTVSPEALIEETWNSYKALELPQPMIDYTARWLLENLPKESRQTLVHGDFRNGNLMVDESGIRAVLDWELAQIGDPVRDLAWLCVNSWRFGNSELSVGGFGQIDDLLEAYKDVTGFDVCRADLRFWEVFGSFWWSITTLCMTASWRSGETPSLERPVIGRRSSEAQMDCVNLIIPGPLALPEPKALTQGTQLPMPAELLEGVRKFLKEDVAANADGRTAFLAKVAANSLGIAQREFILGPDLANLEQKGLQKLLGDGELNELRWNLTNALQADMALDAPGLAEHLRLTVAGQLSIDQPRYCAL